MASKILLKKSSVAAKVPLTTDLEYGELAINYADEKLYFKNSSNVIRAFNTNVVDSIDGNTGAITATQLLTSIKTVDGSGSGLDADTLDGLQASSFAQVQSTNAKVNLPVGWYTIATNVGNRAIARFGIIDTNSSDHQSCIFYASHHYGNRSELTILHSGRYLGTPFRHIRIKEGSTYDGAMLQVYIDDATSTVTGFLLLDNVQTSGWVIKDWIPDATDPGGVNNFAALTNTAAQIDLDLIIDGGMATTGEIYAGGKTTQYRVWHQGNDGDSSGLDADLLDGQHGSYYQNAGNLNAGIVPDARLSGTYTGVSITGNAATATALATARTINGVSFDGTANITVADSTKLPLTGGTLSGQLNSQDIFVNSVSLIKTFAATLTTTTPTTIASFAVASFSSGKFFIQATRGTEKQITELSVLHDGTTAFASEYGGIQTGTTLFSVDVSLAGGTVSIMATSTSATSTVYNVSSTLIGV